MSELGSLNPNLLGSRASSIKLSNSQLSGCTLPLPAHSRNHVTMKAGAECGCYRNSSESTLVYKIEAHPVLTCTGLAQVTYDLLETRGGWRGRVGLLLIDSLLTSHCCDCRCRCNKYPDISAARGSKGLFLRRVVTHLCSGLWIFPILEA